MVVYIDGIWDFSNFFIDEINDNALICVKFVNGIFVGSNNTYEQEVSIFVI